MIYSHNSTYPYCPQSDMRKGSSPYYVICGRPQTINEQSDFGDMVVKAAVQCCNRLQEQGTDVVLLNTAVGGVSCESHFCRRQISSFLEGKSNILGLVDPNHNAKNS